jgi:hypothetical protein
LLGAGLLLALSPIGALWAGDLLTETLAMAGIQLVFAELLIGHAEQRLRIIPVGLAFAFAYWARYDGLMLAAPILAAGLASGGVRRGLPAAGLALLLGLLVYLPWAARNLALGVPVVPR